MDREKCLGYHPQRENIYNRKLPHSAELDADSQRYLQEIKLNLSQSILNNDIDKGRSDLNFFSSIKKSFIHIKFKRWKDYLPCINVQI